MKRAWLTISLLLWSAPAFALTQVQEVKEGSLKAWVIEDHSLPIVTFRMTFENSGAAEDPANKEGLAYFTSQMLDEGAGDMDSLAFHSALESNAIRFSAEAGEDRFTVSFQSLSEYKDRAFALYSLALEKPRFDADAVERVRAGILSELKQLLEDPNYVASLAWKEIAFAGHPYGRPRQGTLASIAHITAEDMHGYAQKYFACPGKTIAVVGDVTVDEVRQWLAKLPASNKCPAAGPALADALLPDGGVSPKIVSLPVAQTVTTASLPGIKRESPRFYTLEVLDYILGGNSLTGRLGKEIRDKRGLAYYAESEAVVLDHAAYMGMNFATRDAEANAAVAVFLGTLKDVAEKGVTDQEVSDAKNYLSGSFALQIDSQMALSGYLLGMQHYHLGMDYLDRRNGLINAVTATDVNAMARDLLSHRPLIVMAGAPGPSKKP